MSTVIKRHRGTTAQHAAYTGPLGEITIDTDKLTAVVHDGATEGGWALATEARSVHPGTGRFAQEVTGFYWEADGARIHRVADRLMLGDSVAYDGSESLITGDGSWLWSQGAGASKMSWIELNATVASVASRGIGVTGAARHDGLTTGSALGGAFFALNDGGANTKVYGIYAESVRNPGTGRSVAQELDITNLEAGATAAGLSPYAPFTFDAGGLSIASGGDVNVNPTTYAADFALAIVNNGSTFKTGIVFANTGLTRDGGSTGRGHAIRMAYDHAIEWYEFTTSTLGFSIVSQVADADHKQELRVSNSGMTLLDDNGKAMGRITWVDSAVNYVSLVPAIAGSGVQVRADGDNVNVNIGLFPKGASGESRLNDNAGVNLIRASSAGLGFYNAAPIARPTGVAVTAAGIHAALVSLGLIAA